MKDLIGKVQNECLLKTMSKIEDKSINLIIADFPYFEVKGDFDFIWKDFDEFLVWVEVCAKEFKRILSDNGSLYVYGHAKKIAYKQIIFDKYFNLENNLKWYKTDCQTRIGLDVFNSYSPVTEHILFYSNEVEETGLQTINNDNNLYIPIIDYFKEQRELIKESLSTINKIAFGDTSGKDGMAGNILSSYKKGWSFPTEEKYNKLQKYYNVCMVPYFELRSKYEVLKKEYEDLMRPFNNRYRLDDVMMFAQEVQITGKYDHPTQKPPKLTKALIETSTNSSSLVYIPFGGSGVEAEQCEVLGLKWITGDLDSKYCDIIKDRVKHAKGEVGLFAKQEQGSLFWNNQQTQPTKKFPKKNS